MHDAHIKTFKNNFKAKVQSLENKLFEAENTIFEKESLIASLTKQLHGDGFKSGNTLTELVGSSKNGIKESNNASHQQVLARLEKQLEVNRLECQKEIQNAKEE